MAKNKEIVNEGNLSDVEGNGNEVKQEVQEQEPKTIQTFAEVKTPIVEEIMPINSVDFKKSLPTDYKFAIGDDVEVHGLEECRREHIIGKITKLLDGYMYALDGHAYPLNKHSINRIGKIVRTFKEVNLRKVVIRHQ